MAGVPRLLGLGLVAGAMVVGGSVARGMVTAAPAGAFEFRYHVQLDPLPTDARELRLWIPLASTTPHQTILAREIHAPGAYEIRRDPDYGNEFLYLALSRPLPPTVAIEIVYRAKTRRETLHLVDTPALERLTGPAWQLHLRSNTLMRVDDQVRALAQEVTAGRATPLEKAQAIWAFVLANMVYDKGTPGYGQGDTLRACAVGRGNCTDFHSLFISLARAAEVPARFHIGVLLPKDPEAEIPGYHCWADVYMPEAGWVPVDASEAWKHPERAASYFGTYDGQRFLVSTGRDIRLTPPPADGRPINMFIYPLVEVDGRTLHQVKTTFRVTRTQA